MLAFWRVSHTGFTFCSRSLLTAEMIVEEQLDWTVDVLRKHYGGIKISVKQKWILTILFYRNMVVQGSPKLEGPNWSETNKACESEWTEMPLSSFLESPVSLCNSGLWLHFQHWWVDDQDNWFWVVKVIMCDCLHSSKVPDKKQLTRKHRTRTFRSVHGFPLSVQWRSALRTSTANI